MKLKHVLIGIFALMLSGILVVLWLAPTGPARAPSLAITSIKGDRLEIPDPQRRPQLVVFWATTCPGCLREVPHLIELYQKLAPRGLQIIGVAMDYDRPDRVIALSAARNIPYPVALDLQGRTAQAFGDVRQTPTTFLIAPDGRIVHRKTGAIDMDKVHNMIDTLLNQERIAAATPEEAIPHALD